MNVHEIRRSNSPPEVLKGVTIEPMLDAVDYRGLFEKAGFSVELYGSLQHKHVRRCAEGPYARDPDSVISMGQTHEASGLRGAVTNVPPLNHYLRMGVRY